MNLTVRDHHKTGARIPHRNGGKEVYYPCSDGKPMGETGIHVHTILTLLQSLTHHFRRADDVAVIANMMFYYVEGDPRKVISPDVFVVRGVGNHLRRIYRLWDEAPPDVVFEISSRGTRQADLKRKFLLYQEIGVKEYYVFDPEYDYLGDEPLRAFWLVDGIFEKREVIGGRILSDGLGLELVNTGKTLRLRDPESGEFLKNIEELAESFEAASNKIGEMQSEMGEMQTEMGEMQTEMGEMQSEMGEMQTEMGEMQTEIGEMQTEMGELQLENGKLESELGWLEAENLRLRAEIEKLKRS